MGRPSRRAFLAGALAATALAPTGLKAQTPTPLRVAYFPGVGALPLLVALKQGTFTHEGLDVSATPTPNSAELFQKLDSGALDLAHTSIDNPIAYNSGVGAAPTQNRDFIAIMGVDDGMLRLVARPGIATIADLKGKTLAVDAMSTGYAFALRAMLEKGGLRDGEYTLVAKGGTQQRAEALGRGEFDATLVTPPFDFDLATRGYTTLAKATEMLGPYQGISIVVRRAWLNGHRETAVKYARAFRAALAATTKDPATSTALLGSALKVSDAVARQSFAAAFGPGGGVHADGALDMAGIATVLALRAKYAPPGAGSDPARFVDDGITAALTTATR